MKISKSRLAAAAAPKKIHHHAEQAPSNVGLLETVATNENLPHLRVMSSIMKNKENLGYDVTTVIQYQNAGPWVVYSREWSSSIRSAASLLYRESRKAFKQGIARAFAASLHADVFVPDTDDIDC